jgi:hypothetical protein
MQSAMKKSAKKPALTKKVRRNHPLVGSWIDPKKKRWTAVRYDHPLVGKWQEVENNVQETSAIFDVTVIKGQFVVNGIDETDGTKFRISNVRWDGKRLHFTSVFPPTGHRAKHVFQAIKPDLVNHWITYTDLELWRRRPPKEGRSA